jgi:aromatic ring-opening dioxygenase catalytic subunit (LigB family)
MAKLVGVFAASHAPLAVRAFEAAKQADREAAMVAYREIGKRINAAKPDILIVVSPDHWVNFFINNMPAVAIAVGEEHVGPPEPWMKAFPHANLPGHPAFAQHLANAAFANDFEPSLTYRMELDHGICIPLWKAELHPVPALVPVILNTVEPPMISIRRCLAWGDLIRKSIESFPGNVRIAVLATGGLSHSIGEPDMGRIDEPFDYECIERFKAGDREKLVSFVDRKVEAAGNGAAEVRNWLVAHAVAGDQGFENILYRSIPEWYVGCCWAAWNLQAAH